MAVRKCTKKVRSGGASARSLVRRQAPHRVLGSHQVGTVAAI